MPEPIPLRDKLRVKVLPQAERSAIIQTIARETPLRRCEILAVGPDCTLSVGSIVLVNILSGQQFGDSVVVPQHAVVAQLEEL